MIRVPQNRQLLSIIHKAQRKKNRPDKPAGDNCEVQQKVKPSGNKYSVDGWPAQRRTSAQPAGRCTE